MLFKRTLHVLYLVGFTVFLVVLVTGLPYYSLPLSDRPHAEMHTTMKPGGALTGGTWVMDWTGIPRKVSLPGR